QKSFDAIESCPPWRTKHRPMLSARGSGGDASVAAANEEVTHLRFRLDEELGIARQVVHLFDVGPGVRLDVIERVPVADDEKLRDAVVGAGHDVGAKVARNLLDPVDSFAVQVV